MNDSNISKIPLFGWCLFDFANSIPAVIGGIYFSKWFIEDVGAGSIMFNILFFFSSIFIMLTGKWIGKKIDFDGYKFWIKFSSVITFMAILSLFLESQFLSKALLIPFSFLFFLIFLIGYQVSRICHNVYLNTVIPKSIQSKMSGLGSASNWAGSVIGIVITIPIITIYSGEYGRELTFLVATISYGVFVSISLFFMFFSLPSNTLTTYDKSENNSKWFSAFISTGFLFLIYLLLFDVMSTVQRNLPPFLSLVFNMSDKTQSIGFLMILFSAIIGGLISSLIINFNNSTTWLKICSLSLAVSIIFITLNNQISLWVAFIIAGISYGMLESTMRLNFMKTFSPENSGKNFAIFAVIERTSGVIGPLIWIIPFLIGINETKAYILAMLLMSGLTCISFILLFFDKNNLIRKSN